MGEEVAEYGWGLQGEPGDVEVKYGPMRGGGYADFRSAGLRGWKSVRRCVGMRPIIEFMTCFLLFAGGV